MKVFGCNFPLFVLLLVVVLIQCIYCKPNHHGNHGKHGNHGNHGNQGHHSVVKKPVNHDVAVHTCQPGDYYIISHLLAFYVAYSTKFLGYVVDEKCPVAITACHTFVHKEGDCTYFWKTSTGTIEIILGADELDFLLTNLAGVDVPTIYNELIGANGAKLSPETAAFAEQFKTILITLLDQTVIWKFLANFNGAIIYHEIFPPKGVYLDAKTSPLCDLVNVKTPTEFILAIEDNSSIVSTLRAVSIYPYVGSNQKDYVLPDHHECWKYIFGYLSLIDTLPAEIQCIFGEVGLSKYTGNIDINALALNSLHVGGMYELIHEWLYKAWPEYKQYFRY
uniref:Secreted protein n=1 Tax=Lutzomyia longipalpis TaxID=7200 RepID=A0A1B0CGY6_LUTLO